MSAAEPEKLDQRTRVWGIVLMSVLSAVLAFVLISTRSPEAQPEPSIPDSLRAPPAETTKPGAGDYYRAWPLFEGWPLPQTPSPAAPDKPHQEDKPKN